MKLNRLHISFLLLLLGGFSFAQEDNLSKEDKKKALRTSEDLTWEANKELTENDFINAEAGYRKAISKSSENSAAPYNLGNAYYNRESYKDAFNRYKQAAELAVSKTDKHKAYHNMGNVFMQEKEYQKAVEAYKNALRNNPTDEETRYNLALAKEMLKKDQDKNKNDKDQKDKDKDKKDDQKDKKDKKDQGDKGGEEEKDKKDQGDKGDKEKEDQKEGDGDKKKEQDKKPNEGDSPKPQKQPRPNQLSKQQIKNLLEAMQNEEKKVQEKIDAKKVRGVKVKNEKDW